MTPAYSRTRLAQARDRAGVSQAEMVLRTSIPLRTYQRLESGGLRNPPIRHVVKCANALGLTLEEVCEPEWLEFTKPGSLFAKD